MGATTYTASQRGGGTGDTGRRRAAILEQINSWVARARWHDEDRALELFEKVNEAPERFISPDPDADYREEASRIYGELKDEYGLRTESDAVDEYRDMQAAADAHAESRERAPGSNELGGAPEPGRIDWHGHAGERAMKRAQAPTLRPEHSRDYEPADEPEPAHEAAQVALSGPRHTAPVPAAVATLPGPLRSLAAALWVLLTFDRQPREVTHV